MTCIVALKENGNVYMGGDSASVDSQCLFMRRSNNPKVFRNGPYLIGYTTSFRMGQLLQYQIKLPEPEGDLHAFMATEFTEAVRNQLRKFNFTKLSDNREHGGTFIVAVNNEIFEFDDDFHCNNYVQPYIAVGCGREFALGALHAQEQANIEPKVKVFAALSAASEFSIGVAAPFHVLELNDVRRSERGNLKLELVQ